MGWFDRVKDFAGGVGGTVRAPVGLVMDLAKAPFVDDEIDGFLPSIYSHFTRRSGEFLDDVVGKRGIAGTTFGSIPEPLRVAAGSRQIQGGLDKLETGWREGVSEPITTALTAASLSEATGEGPAGLLNMENWRTGYRIAQMRSPGEALSLAIFTKDITNQAEYNEWIASDMAEVVSGVADAVLRISNLDPTNAAATGLRFARKGRREINSATDIKQARNSRMVHKFVEDISKPDMTPDRIRDQFFPKHAHGTPISNVLYDAPDMRSKHLTLMALMGDGQAFRTLREELAPVAGQVDRLMAEKQALLQYQDGTLFHNSDRLASVDAELKTLYPEAQRAQRLEAAVKREAGLQEIPKAASHNLGPFTLPAGNAVRTSFTRSDFFQASPYAAPLRAAFNMNPHRWIRLHDPRTDIHVARFLRQTPLDVEAQGRWRTEYMQAPDPGAKQVVLERMETDVVSAFAKEAGMTSDELRTVLEQARGGRGESHTILNGRSYDGKGRSKVRFLDDDGTTHEINLPAFITQEVNFYALPDLTNLRRATNKIGRWRQRHPNTEIPTELMTSFYKIWRPSVLLRVGWPVRVVGDEQLRIMAKIGTLTHMREQLVHAKNYTTEVIPQTPKAIAATLAAKGGVRARVKAGRDVAMAQHAGVGMRGFRHRNYDIEAAYGAPGEAAEMFREMNSANSAMRTMMATDEEGILSRLRAKTGQYHSLTSDSPEYAQAWAHAVNQQFGQDVIGSRLMRGDSVDDVTQWLRTTPEGQAAATRFHFRAGEDPTEWVELMANIIDDYTLADDVLKQKALTGTATVDDLITRAADPADRPIVHGEIVQQLTGQGVVRETLGQMVEDAFVTLGKHPSDVLSRNQFFDHVYRAEMKRLVDIADEQGPITQEMIDGFQDKARTYALNESKDLLYDLAEQSRLAEILRFMLPFYSAWQEVITRWAGLAVENPAFVARARQVWNAPEKMGLVVDESGNVVDHEGNARQPLLGWTMEPGEERYINMQLLPGSVRSFLSAVPGAKQVVNMKFNKKSFNMALSMPGVGPVVQLPVNEVVKNRPELEASVKAILPFGTTPEVMDILLPATAKRAYAKAEGEENRLYTNSLVSMYKTMEVNYSLGKSNEPPTYEEAKRRTDAMWNMRTFASWVSPAAPVVQSPYQQFIDAYRAGRERYFDWLRAQDEGSTARNPLGTEQDPDRSPDEWFLDTFGPDYFALTGSLSKSMDGVQPTLEGFKTRKKYQELIDQFPEFGGLIVGSEGAGEFHGAVYDYQLTHGLAPGSQHKQRETPPFEEQQHDPQVRLGWITYRRMMDLIDAERIQRGLPNLQVKAARDLAQIKSGFTQELIETNEAWAREFQVVDQGAWDRKLKALKQIATAEAFDDRSDRPEMGYLREYFRRRDMILKELAGRRAVTLNAASNMDLAHLWESMKAELVEGSLQFGDLYYRFLERDPMTVPRQMKRAS